jgi:hypothetical protein
LGPNGLSVFLEEYAKMKTAKVEHPVPADAQPIRPILREPGTGSGHLAFWEGSGAGATLQIRTLRKDGSIHAGPAAGLTKGRLAWGQAFYTGNYDRQWLLAIERNGQTSLDLIRWGKDESKLVHAALKQYAGIPLQATAFLGNDDAILGAVLVKAKHETGGWDYFVHAFEISPTGAFTAKQPVRLQTPQGVEFRKAFMEISLKGTVMALMESTDGRWYLHASDGAKYRLEKAGQPGTPLGLCWASDPQPKVLFWTPNAGFDFVGIAREN